jgi:hypothetical protein
VPENYTLSETASEAAKLLSKLQRTGSGFERWIIQNASLPSHKQFAVLRESISPPQHVYRQAASATNNGGETCSIANQPGVAMAEFNLKPGWWNSLARGKNTGNFELFSASNALYDRRICWRHLSPPQTSDAVSMQQEQETSVQDQGILVRRTQSSETVTALEPIS